ncbi:LysE family transporter [uncultured Jatrophihabitans sp.]|uniref:LysE family transporter n=1 Tax=uncultured Jatrophihabitans sp. TaxID=1610747 RepID=UPI0035CBBEAB
MTSALVAGAVAGYGVALPVGAVATYLVGLGAREPFPAAAAAALGVATTDGLFALVAAAGGVGLQTFLRPVSRPLTYLAAAVLIALATRTAVAAAHRHRHSSTGADTGIAAVTPLRAYLALVALTALNPSTLAYFVALALGGQSDDRGLTIVAAVVFASGAFLASASWQLALAGSGATMRRLITGSRGQLTVAAVSAAIMAALAARLIVS